MENVLKLRVYRIVSWMEVMVMFFNKYWYNGFRNNVRESEWIWVMEVTMTSSTCSILKFSSSQDNYEGSENENHAMGYSYWGF